jgi:hypothetical protein
VNDDDAGLGGDARFSGIKVFEQAVGPLPPTLTNPGEQQGRLNSPVSLQISGFDPNGDEISYTATNLPPGLSISLSGLITGVPTETGTWSVSVTANDTSGGTDSMSFDWVVLEPLQCPDCVDFATVTTVGFGTQDVDSDVQVLDGGLTILLSGNTWRRTVQTYEITPNTLLEFTFESTGQGEVQGIGFTVDDVVPNRSDRIFQVWGVQSWGIRDFTYVGAGPQTFQIPVGQYYTGSGFRLVLVNDDDAGLGGDARFSGIRIIE